MKLKTFLVIAVLIFSVVAARAQSSSVCRWEPIAKTPGTDVFSKKNIFFVDENNGWLVSVGGKTVFKTADGGKTWAKVKAPKMIFSAVYFLDDRRGWIIGSKNNKNALYQTADGGKTWRFVRLAPVDYPGTALTDIEFAAGGRVGWLVGTYTEVARRYGTAFKTEDGGQTWTHTDAKLTQDGFNTLEVVDENTVFIGGASSIIKTADGGQTWETSFDQQRELDVRDIEFVSRAEGWAVGFQTDVLHTTDGGKSWTNLVKDFQNNFPEVKKLLEARRFPLFVAVEFADQSTGWLAGDGGLILATRNGGKDWIQQSSGSRAFIQELARTKEYLFAVGDDGLILRKRLKNCSD